MIKVNYHGRLGNNMFQYCFGRILSEELHFNLDVKPIKYFSNIQPIKKYNFNLNNLCTEELEKHEIDFISIINNKTPRIIILNGYFQRYEYYEKYLDKIKQWLEIDLKYENNFIINVNPKDFTLHIRLTDLAQLNLHPNMIKFYKDILDNNIFETLYIITDNKNDKRLIKIFKEYNYQIISNSEIEDFLFIKKSNNIICSQSTFCWWAAILSDAKNIYLPTNTHIGYYDRADINLNFIS